MTPKARRIAPVAFAPPEPTQSPPEAKERGREDAWPPNRPPRWSPSVPERLQSVRYYVRYLHLVGSTYAEVMCLSGRGVVARGLNGRLAERRNEIQAKLLGLGLTYEQVAKAMGYQSGRAVIDMMHRHRSKNQ